MKLIMAGLLMMMGSQAYAQAQFRIAPQHAYLEIPKQDVSIEANGQTVSD
ncbi:MAG: hypothetical protein HRU19_11230 [Pseudobacteriovorax sp.]|nr:hypothetical protein [Pseudobacteriovorax sp.]